MNTDGHLNPDRIRGGIESADIDSTERSSEMENPSKYATDRGNSDYFSYQEAPNHSSLRDIEQYRKISFPDSIDAESRKSFSLYTLILLGLFVVGGIVALVVLSISGAPTAPVYDFLTGLETPIFSVVSLIAGFFFGRAGSDMIKKSQ